MAERSSAATAGNTPGSTPPSTSSPASTPDRAYLLVMMTVAGGNETQAFYAVIPFHEPGRIWDKILSALSPARCAKALAGWVIEGVHGSICGVVERASGEDADQLPEGVRRMSDILTGTPPDLTYANEMVRHAWMVVWAITSGALVVILGWMGLSLIVAEHLGRQQAGWREMVPRLVLGLVAASSSLWWCALVLDVADAVSGFIATSLNVTPGDLLRAPLDTFLTAVQAGSVGMAQVLALLYLVYGFFVLYVIVQMVLRLALIDILLALAPIALGLWILPHTAGWGRHWLRLFMTTVFQQAVQLIALALGFGFLNEFAAVSAFEPVQDLIWKLLLSVAFVYMATRVPSMMGNSSTFDAWLSTLYFGMNLPSSLMRSGPDDRADDGRRRWAGRHGRGRDGGQRGRFGRRQRPELGGIDGHALGRRGRRRSPSEQRRVTTTTHRRGRETRRPTPTPEDEKCAANGA